MLDKLFRQCKQVYYEVRALERATKRVKFRRFFATTQGAQDYGVQKSAEGFDAYFGVAPRSSNEPVKEKEQKIQLIAALWGDLDTTVWDVFPLPPSIVVSSGKGHHVYWILTTPCEDVKQAERIMRKLSRSYENFDRGCWAATHFLRIPGTLNHKYVPAKQVEIVHESSYTYDLSDLEAMSNLSQGVVTKIREGAIEGEDRSGLDWHVICNLVSAGFSDEAIEFIYRTFPIGSKYAERGANYLQGTIDNARKEVDSVPQVKQIKIKGVKNKDDQGDTSNPNFTVDNDNIDGETDEDITDARTKQKMDDLELIEFDGGLWDLGGKKPVKITDFTFKVEGMITPNSSSVGNTIIGEAFVCTLFASGHRWDKVVFPTECFVSDKALRGHLKRATWTFSGSSRHAVAVQRLMRQMWEEGGRNTQLTTSTIGLQLVENRWLFVQTDGTIFDATTGEVCENVLFTNTRTIGTLPPVSFEFTGVNKLTAKVVQETFNCLVNLRQQSITVPLLGWMVASYFKHRILDYDPTLRFPLFMVSGTQGSGKTTILRQFKRLVGVRDSVDGVSQISASTTRFVLNAALAGSTTIPIHLTEFREQTMRADGQLGVTLRQAYDGSSDPRGRADQTTVNYHFTAPVLLDGEEFFQDPALMERTLLLPLQKHEIAQNEIYRANNKRINSLPVETIASSLLLFTQQVDLIEIMAEAQNYLDNATETYRHLLPDRVFNNCLALTIGLVVVEKYLSKFGVKCPYNLHELHEYLHVCLSQVVDLSTGHTKLNVDGFVQAVLHRVAIMQTNLLDTSFQYKVLMSPEGSMQVCFNLSSAYNWWIREVVLRNQQRTIVTEERALQKQLVGDRSVEHGGYVVEVRRIRSATDVLQRMYVVDVLKAVAHGLDVPESYIHVGEMPTVTVVEGKLKLSPAKKE